MRYGRGRAIQSCMDRQPTFVSRSKYNQSPSCTGYISRRSLGGGTLQDTQRTPVHIVHMYSIRMPTGVQQVPVVQDDAGRRHDASQSIAQVPARSRSGLRGSRRAIPKRTRKRSHMQGHAASKMGQVVRGHRGRERERERGSARCALWFSKLSLLTVSSAFEVGFAYLRGRPWLLTKDGGLVTCEDANNAAAAP